MIVGLTGGIGSGKSTVAQMFQELGIPVYISDTEAKNLMNSSSLIKDKIKALLGDQAIKDNLPNRPYIASKVFNNKSLLEQLNKIVHPEVDKHFKHWYKQQNSPFVIKEAAILFETGGNKKCDVVITVTATQNTKIERVIKRDNTTREEVLQRMNNQWPDEKKIALSDFVITNEKLDATRLQVKQILQFLLKKLNTR